jgi:hypothetical protein
MTYEINYNNTFWNTFELGLNFEPASQSPVRYLVSEYPLKLWYGHSSVLHHNQIQLPAQLGSGVRTVCRPLCSWLITLSNLRDHQLLHHFGTNVGLIVDPGALIPSSKFLHGPNSAQQSEFQHHLNGSLTGTHVKKVPLEHKSSPNTSQRVQFVICLVNKSVTKTEVEAEIHFWFMDCQSPN